LDVWDVKIAARVALAVALLSSPACAQDSLVRLVVESTTIKPSQTAEVKLRLTIPRDVQAAGLNWTFRFPARAIEDVIISAGPVAEAAKKSVQCSSASGQTKCLVFGLNTNVLASGTLATVAFKMRRGIEESKLEIQVVDLVVASPSGTSIRCAGSSGSISFRR
jgi:hypothetical protein